MIRPYRSLIVALIMISTSVSAQSSFPAFDSFFQAYDAYAVSDIQTRRFTQRELIAWVQPFVKASVVSSREVGRSAEDRPLTLYRYGSGPVSVLLWSQMHGDEPTATMAIVDILSFLHKNANDARVRMIRERLSIHLFPMVNPDGAERFTRRTSQHIDMNRDALRLATPEARTLKRIRDELQPAFGFNLHDQDPRYTVGTTRKLTAIALLTPAYNEARSDNVVRSNAKRLASLLAQMLSTQIPGHVAKWDDTFEPRAFGDNVQRWGTSTILIESGGWKNDPEKMYLRRLNATVLLSAFVAIADGSYDRADVSAYESLPFNMRLGFDMLLTHCTVHSNSRSVADTVDIGLNREERLDVSTGKVVSVWTVEDIGDLHTYAAYDIYDLAGAQVDPRLLVLEQELSEETLKSLIPRKQD